VNFETFFSGKIGNLGKFELCLYLALEKASKAIIGSVMNTNGCIYQRVSRDFIGIDWLCRVNLLYC
jgi:hypothetical protein